MIAAALPMLAAWLKHRLEQLFEAVDRDHAVGVFIGGLLLLWNLPGSIFAKSFLARDTIFERIEDGIIVLDQWTGSSI